MLSTKTTEVQMCYKQSTEDTLIARKQARIARHSPSPRCLPSFAGRVSRRSRVTYQFSMSGWVLAKPCSCSGSCNAASGEIWITARRTLVTPLG